MPRERLAELTTDDRDPMGILDRQDSVRVPELVPLRTERMAASAFAFYRGTAAIMAADLGASPSTTLSVGSCGDAHVSNFGLYASPQRSLVFDLNDFDEAAWAPFEWDLKRLVTSVVISGRDSGRSTAVITAAALGAVKTYASALAAGIEDDPLDLYFERFDPKEALRSADDSTKRALKEAMEEAERRTGARALRRLTTVGDSSRLTFVEQPPTMTRLDPRLEQRVLDVIGLYVQSANVDIRVLMRRYAVADAVRRVVGVGSVGTRCYLVAMQDGDGHAIILQAKEAGVSVLVEYGGAVQPPEVLRYIDSHSQGGRVVAMQRILQAVSDPLLGHLSGVPVDGGPERAFYVRQFHDKKGGLEVDTLADSTFTWYASACAASLARAHGQSPDAALVAGYLGAGKTAGEAILQWAEAYAELSRADWQLFRRHRGVD